MQTTLNICIYSLTYSQKNTVRCPCPDCWRSPTWAVEGQVLLSHARHNNGLWPIWKKACCSLHEDKDVDQRAWEFDHEECEGSQRMLLNQESSQPSGHVCFSLAGMQRWRTSPLVQHNVGCNSGAPVSSAVPRSPCQRTLWQTQVAKPAL